MITQEIRKLLLSKVEAEEKAAFTSKDAVYDPEKEELIFTVNHASGKFFRLLYDNKKVSAIVEGTENTITSTMRTIEEFDTEKEVFDRIAVLGLEYDPPLLETD